MEPAGPSGLSLIVWQGWGVLSVMAALTALLATILAWLLPFPDRSIARQLSNYDDRMAIRARLGAAPILDTYFLMQRRFSDWLMEWFGQPFSGQAFERNLAIAFIFPIGLFLVTLLTNGLTSGRVAPVEVAVFAAAFLIVAYVISAAFSNLLRLVERLWQTFGGDKDLATTISKVLLGAFAVMVAFTIAFSIASTFSGDFANAGTVLGAMAGGFALAFAFAVAFALAGAALFAVVVAIIGGAALAFASEFAFLLFLFFIIIPVVNASVDWLSWGITRILMNRARNLEADAIGIASLVALTLATFAVGAVLMVGLAALLPNAIEALNAAFAAGGLATFNWRDIMARAVKAPWTDGLFVTGMMLTTIVPAAVHFITGFAGAFARFSPATRTAADMLSEHPEVAPAPSDVGPVKLTLILARVWYIIAIAVTIALIAGVAALISQTHASVADFLARIALCSTSWSHGKCALF